MKITLLVTLLFGLVFLTTVGAAERTLTPQQQRMTDGAGVERGCS